ncbi:MAG: glycosyltransferase family 2 protein, partial [Lacticaseibacillus paracasei]
MKSAPRVSVIVPAYNAAAYLPATIQSVRQQTFQDFEIWVV